MEVFPNGLENKSKRLCSFAILPSTKVTGIDSPEKIPNKLNLLNSIYTFDVFIEGEWAPL